MSNLDHDIRLDVVAHVNQMRSTAVRHTIGVGSSAEPRRSIRIAAERARRFELPIKGSVLASDAFFLFCDNVDEAAELGVSAIIQPGGSVKDEDSIAAANEHGIAMVFTGIRHFRH